MSISPIITFKAGICDFDDSVVPPKVKAIPTPGYVYLWEEDDLLQFGWRPRPNSPFDAPLKLAMVPGDGRFIPYKDAEKSNDTITKSPTNGRIFVLRFQSSSLRHFFWLQSKSEHPHGDPAWFSKKDLKLGSIVDRLLQGDEVNARDEIDNVQNEGGDGGGGDAEMEDAGPDESRNDYGETEDPFTGHQEDEGGDARNAGADGGRAPADDATAAVQNFLRSMQGSQALKNAPAQSRSQGPQGQMYTTLMDLLPTSTTVPVIDSADSTFVDNLLSNIPPVLLLLAQEGAQDVTTADPNSETVKAAIEALSLDQKKEILRKVLRSPQFHQSLGSLTSALRDGGLPTISDALNIPVENGGLVRRGTVPLGGGDAVEAFVKGVKTSVEKETKDEGRMETD